MKGKIAIVTGGGSGIGRATCKELAAQGATVIVSDRDDYSAQKTCGIILEDGNTALALKADVSKSQEIQKVVKFGMEKFGRIDILVNNAGIGGVLAFMDDYPDEAYKEVMSINLDGVWYGMKSVLSIMKQQRFGSIVNVSSVAGISGASRMSAYAASKHGIIGLTRTASDEYAKYGLKINAVCPSVVDTEMGRSYLEYNSDILEMIKSKIPMKRFGEAEEVAELIVWLCSDKNGFVTGQAIAIDGGMTS